MNKGKKNSSVSSTAGTEVRIRVKSLADIEKEHITYVLHLEPKLEKAAEYLGITTVTLWRKRKLYGIL